MVGLRRISKPELEPVTLNEAKLHLRVSHDDEDTLINALISAARAYIEDICSRSLLTQQWELTLDCFPGALSWGYWDSSNSHDHHVRINSHYPEIRLSHPPLQQVDSIQYLDPSGTLTLLDPSQYVVDATPVLPRLFPPPGVVWPMTALRPSAVTIRYTAGALTRDDIPPGIKPALLLLIANWYEERQPIERMMTYELPLSVTALIWQHRIFEAL